MPFLLYCYLYLHTEAYIIILLLCYCLLWAIKLFVQGAGVFHLEVTEKQIFILLKYHDSITTSMSTLLGNFKYKQSQPNPLSFFNFSH